MTKQEEMEALRSFVQTLPRESYLQPMLVAALPVIERDILSDIEPDLLGFIVELQRQRLELEEQLKELRKMAATENDRMKKQSAEVERLSRQADQFRKQLRGMQESLKTVLQW